MWSVFRWSCVVGHYVDDDLVVFVECGFFNFTVCLVEFVCGVFDDFVVCGVSVDVVVSVVVVSVIVVNVQGGEFPCDCVDCPLNVFGVDAVDVRVME